MAFKGYFDGASRGNPGEAGAGALILDEEGKLVWEGALYLGLRTNNEAEYEGLIFLLEEAARRGLGSLAVHGDSRLVICQMKGEWKIREPRLRALALRARKEAAAMSVTYTWVPRERNSGADALSNRAIDEKNGQAKPASAAFPSHKLERVGKGLYVAHGSEDYVVDVPHGICSCPAFQHRGKCKHLEAAKELE
jgi:ribonuclease HI